jgi:hypothetical protein
MAFLNQNVISSFKVIVKETWLNRHTGPFNKSTSNQYAKWTKLNQFIIQMTGDSKFSYLFLYFKVTR